MPVTMRCIVKRVSFYVVFRLLSCCVLLVCAQESTKIGNDITLTFSHQMASEENRYICYVLSPGADQPFYSDGNIDPTVLHEGQADRFQVQIQQLGMMITISVTITSVKGIDAGLYNVTVLESDEGFDYSPAEYNERLDVIFSPPTASCTVKITVYSDRWRLVTCTTSASNVNHAICCFQQSRLVPYKGAIECDINHACSNVFWMKPEHSISCCASENCTQVNQTSCTDSSHPAQVTTTQPSIASSASYERLTGSPSTTSKNETTRISENEAGPVRDHTILLIVVILSLLLLLVICVVMYTRRKKNRRYDRPSTMYYSPTGDNTTDGDVTGNVV